MNDLLKITISSEAEFLAHVIALKQESEERLQIMADCLSEHNNFDAAEVFQHLAEIIRKNIKQLENKAINVELPEIAPWEYQWHCADDPDSICMDQAHYMMSARESLELALFNEQRSVEFFNRVYAEVNKPEVRNLAEHLIKTEKDYAEVISQRLEEASHDELLEDLDPPNMPE